MSQKDLDTLFRDALGEGRAQPRPDSWARVAAGLTSEPANSPAKPKRRVLWYRYAAVASVVLAAAAWWWARPEIPSSAMPAAHLAVAALPSESAEVQTEPAPVPAPATQQPLSSPGPSVHALDCPMPNKFESARADVAFLERMSPVETEEWVPLIPPRLRPAEAAAYAIHPEAPRRRYAELANNLQDVWSTVRSLRESEASPQVIVEVHVPAAVLQRINQTKELAENLTESWSTYQSKHLH